MSSEVDTTIYKKGARGLVRGLAKQDLRLADGTPLLQGRTITDFTNEDEDHCDRMVGQPVMPFRIEDLAVAQGASFVKGLPFEAFAVQDGHLITGQQQHSSRKTAQFVIEALGEME